jgi:hypothetical protein
MAGGKIWTKEELELLKNNYATMQIECLLSLLPNKTLLAIRTKARRLNLTKKHTKKHIFSIWTDAEIELLKNNYNFQNIDALISLFPNRTKSAIQVKAHSLNLKTLKKFNENMFETPNNLNSYYAGFIAADGCITDKNNLQIALQKSDSDFLKKFNSFMECSREIRYSEQQLNFKNFYKATITYQSKKLATDLLTNFLLKPRKTLNVDFPKHLSLDMKLSYVVGNFDGDGCLSISKNKF